jgi:hypothetical protein
MSFLRKLALTVVASALSVGLAGVTVPASAADSAWGCGGWCRSAPEAP